jgi:site-specific recombinase XerC
MWFYLFLSLMAILLTQDQRLSAAVIRMHAPAHSKPLLLDEFCRWMREHRGSSELTLYNYGLPIRELIRRFGEDPDKLDAQSLRTFVLSQSRNVGWAKAKRCTTALRMFLRFLIAKTGVVPVCSAPFPWWPTGG